MKIIAKIIVSLMILATTAFSGFLGYVVFNQREQIVKLESQVSKLVEEEKPIEDDKQSSEDEQQPTETTPENENRENVETILSEIND